MSFCAFENRKSSLVRDLSYTRVTVWRTTTGQTQQPYPKYNSWEFKRNLVRFSSTYTHRYTAVRGRLSKSSRLVISLQVTVGFKQVLLDYSELWTTFQLYLVKLDIQPFTCSLQFHVVHIDATRLVLCVASRLHKSFKVSFLFWSFQQILRAFSSKVY